MTIEILKRHCTTIAMDEPHHSAANPTSIGLTRTIPLCCLLRMQINSIANLTLLQLRRAVAIKEQVAALESEFDARRDNFSPAAVAEPGRSLRHYYALRPCPKPRGGVPGPRFLTWINEMESDLDRAVLEGTLTRL